MSNFDLQLNEELEKLKKKKKQNTPQLNTFDSQLNEELEHLKKYGTNTGKDTGKYKDRQDDIAPVNTKKKKDEEEDKPWYKSGLFEDGYDFGDVSKTILGLGEDKASLLDLTWNSAERGFYNARYGEETYKAMTGQKNQKEAVEAILADDKYDFAPGSTVGKAVSGAFELLGQQARQWTHPRSLAAATGAAGAAALAGQAGPQVLAPEEIITVPGAFIAGMTAGSAGTNYEIEAGHAYNEMLEAGISEETAKKVAVGVGGINAALELVQLDELTDAYKVLSKTGTADTAIKRIAKELLDRGVDIAKETAQEVAQEGVTITGTQMASKLDKGEWAYNADEVTERLGDTAISSSLSFGMMNAPAAVKNTVAIAKDQKATTSLTDTEKAVVKKVIEDRVAEQEEKGVTLTTKEKAAIEKGVLRDLDKGYISTDTIEEVLGDRSSYDALSKEAEEYDTLYNTPSGQLSKAQQDRLTELDSKNKANPYKDALNVAKERYSNSVFELVKGGRLSESYNERARRGQVFEADLTQYDAKQQAVVQNAIDSGILNNTNRTHEFVDLIAKISADKGVLFDFVNNAKLKESSFAVDGKTVNGYFDTKNGSIGVNIDSAKALTTIVGHEITHVLEGTDFYTELQNAVIEYAKTKGDYQGRFDSLSKLYEGIEGADVNAELTADLVGDYLFTDEDFINNLSTNHRNVFQKIYDEVKYLLKIATAGSKEARELEKVKKAFEDAYRADNKAQGGTKYSLTDKTKPTYEELVAKNPVQIVNVKGGIESGSYADMKIAAMKKATSEGWFDVPHHNTDTDSLIFLTEKSFSHAYSNLRSDFGEDTIRCMAHIPEIIQNAVLVSVDGPRNPTKQETNVYTFFGAVEGVGGIEPVKLTVKEYDFSTLDAVPKNIRSYFEKNGVMDSYDSLYDANALEVIGIEGIKKESDASGKVYEQGSEAQATSDSIISIADLLNLVNGDATKYIPKKQYSMSDSDGKRITDVQNEKGLDRKSEVQFSLSNDTAYMDKAISMNNSSLRVDGNVMTDAKAIRERIAARMNDIKDRGLVGLPEDIEGNTYIANSSYDGTEENTTICPRSLASEAFVDAVSEYLGRPLTVEEQIYISQDLQGRSLTPECTYCYVATDRKAYRAFLGEYINQRDAVLQKVKDNPNVDVSRNGELYKEFLNGRKDTNPMYDRFKMWVNAYKNGTPMVEASHLANINRLMGDINSEFGAELKPQIVDAMKYAQSASWAKKRINYVAYNGHILKWKQDRINKLNSHYGLRMYSFSDFHPAFVLENMQMITDASVRGLKMLGYTKDTDFVEIFAPSGMNINVSTFGFETGGNVYENNIIGAEWEKAKALREQYPNVGITFVATNDHLVNWALDQDWIDVVIPYHLVRTGAEVAKAFNYTNYTSESADTKTADWVKGDKKFIAPTEHNNDKATYLAALEKNHLKPRFERFIGNPNYMKLVNECRQSASESKPVQPVFNEDAAMVALAKLEANGYYQPVGGSVDRMYEIAAEVAENMQSQLAPAMSLSEIGEQPRRYGDYNIYGKDIGLHDPLAEFAPVAENATTEDSTAVANKTKATVSETESVAPVVISKNETTTVTPEEMRELFPDDLSQADMEMDNLLQQKESLEAKMLEMGNTGDFSDFDAVNEEYLRVTGRLAELENEVAESEAGRIGSLDDAAVPPETEAPYVESGNEAVENPFEDRDWYNVGNQKVKAYMYENPEVKPFFQEEALGLMSELRDTTRGERYYNDQAYLTGGNEEAWTGVSRHTSKSMEILLDSWGMSYADIEKGLNAIIEDNGAENIAAAKKIEFMLNDRLLNGYTDFYSNREVPPNQDYINLLAEKQINEYSKEAFDSFMANADQYAPADIAPVKAPTAVSPYDAMGAAPYGFDPITELQYKYGNLPDGEHPVREDSMPKSITGKDRVSLTARTVKGAGATPDEFVDLLHKETLGGRFSYIPITNSDTVQKAYNDIVKKGWEAARGEWETKVRRGEVSAELTATGSLLLNHAAKAEDRNAWLSVLHDYQIMGTNAGQAVQAMRILKTLTPDDSLYMIERSVEQMVEDMKLGREIVIDDNLKQNYLNAKTDGERDAARKALAENIAKQIPSTAMDMWTALRYLNMLGNFRTQVRNIVGNLGMSVTSGVRNTVATSIEWLANKASGGKFHRTKSIFVNKGQLKAARNDFENVKTVALNGGKFNDPMAKSLQFQQEVQDARRIFKIAPPVEWYRRATNWAMDTGDLVFSKVAYGRALAGYLKANGIKETDFSKIDQQKLDEARAYAINEAQETTFRDNNWFSSWVSKLGRGKNTPKGVKIVSEGVMPFRKTPANILLRAEEYSPLGFVNATVKSIQAAKGKVTGADVVNSWAKALTGTGLFALGMWLNNSGILSGGPDEDDDKEWFESQYGWQNYAIQIGDKNYTIDFLSPAAMPLLMGAQLNELRQNSGVELKDLEKALLSIADPMIEMSMLQGLNDTLDNIRYAESNMGQFLVNACVSYLTQGLTNSFLGQLERSFEGQRMSTYTDKDSDLPAWLQKALGKASAKTPVLDYQQIPYVDAWGETEDIAPLPGFAENALSPSYISQGITDAVYEELNRLNDAQSDINVYPQTPDKTVTFDDIYGRRHEDYNLSAKEYVELAQLQGKTQKKLVEDILSNYQYSGLNDKEKARAVQLAYQYAKEYSRQEVLGADGFSADWMKRADAKGDIVNAIIAHTNDEKTFAYENPEKYQFFTENGISWDDYDSADTKKKQEYSDMYSWVSDEDHPGRYSLAKAVSDDFQTFWQYKSDCNNFNAKDENGETVSGLKKERVIDYINSLDIDYGAKIILFRSMYDGKKDKENYNLDIVDYLNSRDDISYEDMVTILKELDFTVDSEGNISWD